MAISRRNATARRQLTGETRCIGGMCDPQRIQGLKAPAPRGSYSLINLTGPGLFLAGHVTKQGGATGLSFVRLQIDGRSVVDLSFAAAHNFGLTQQIHMVWLFWEPRVCRLSRLVGPFPLCSRDGSISPWS